MSKAMNWLRGLVKKVRARLRRRRSGDRVDHLAGSAAKSAVFKDWDLMRWDNVLPEPMAPEPLFARNDLFVVGAPRSQPPLDPRRLAALEKELAVRGREAQKWRESGHGHIVQVSDEQEALFLEHMIRRPSAEAALLKLIERGDQVAEALGSAAGLIDLQWPSEIWAGYDGGIAGYFGPALDTAFVTTSERSEPAVRTLQFALGGARRRSDSLDGLGRLQLVRITAAWLSAMHSASVIHGSLSASSLAFGSRPARLASLDYATARVLGQGPWNDLAVNGSGGRADTVPESSLDEDRRAFARLAFALLHPDAADTTHWLSVPSQIPGLDERASARMRWLWLRANGDKGTMPTLAEWVTALGPVGTVTAAI